jgi:hypothetical protein
MINLKAFLSSEGSGSNGGRVFLDSSKSIWQKIVRKGHYPSPRCGAAMTTFKNKAILFGGVYDDEGKSTILLLFLS